MADVLVKIQKYIFAIMLATAVLFGVSLAYFSSAVIAYSLRTRISPSLAKGGGKTRRRATPKKSRRPWSDFEELITGNFFRGIPEDTETVTGPGPTEQVKSLSLVGLVSGHPRWASAAIKVQGEKNVNSFGVGQKVGGYKLVTILTNGVVLERSGSQTTLYLGDAKKAPSSGKSGKSSGKTKKSSISKSRLQKLLKDPNELRKIKGTPFTHKGKMVGFKLHYVPRSHVFYSMGARSGDIIRNFNGEKLTSPQQIFKVVKDLQSVSRATIDIERAGAVVTYEFVITD